MTTVQLWWKSFESEAKSKKAASDKSSGDKPAYESSENPKDHWYGVSTDYWGKVEATNDGMLGGFASITSVDLAGSLKFLLPLLQGTDTCVKQKVGKAKAVGTFHTIEARKINFSIYSLFYLPPMAFVGVESSLVSFELHFKSTF